LESSLSLNSFFKIRNQEMKKNQESGKSGKKTQEIRIRKSGNFLIFIFQNQIHKISKFSTC
jgi:hypothetical protein